MLMDLFNIQWGRCAWAVAKNWILDWVKKVISEVLRFSTMYGTLNTFIGQNQAQIFRALCIK